MKDYAHDEKERPAQRSGSALGDAAASDMHLTRLVRLSINARKRYQSFLGMKAAHITNYHKLRTESGADAVHLNDDCVFRQRRRQPIHLQFERGQTLALPLYRIEQDFQNNGLEISRATLANWVIYSAEKYLEPLWNAMKAVVLSEPVVHSDETPVQVLKEKDRSAKQKSYMWVFCSGEFSEKPAVLYMYSTSRSGSNAETFLEGYDKYLVSDGYAGYNGVGAKRCGCFAHVRRRFKDAMPPGTALYEPEKLSPWRTASEDSQKEQYSSTAELVAEMKRQPVKSAVGFYLCNELFELEKLSGKDTDLRIKIREECVKPLLDVFWEWLESVNAANGSSLSKAVNYALNEKKTLVRFLENPLIPISNNRAENSIRPFTVGRKNWLFSVTPKGAKSSAIVYSIIESAKANGLNPYQYLMWLFETMSQADIFESELIASVLPWSTSIPEYCKLEQSF